MGTQNPTFHNIPSSKLTVRPWQLSGMEDEFPLQIGDFQGPTIKIYKRVLLAH